VRTVESLLPVLVLDPRRDRRLLDAAFAQIRSAQAFGGTCGPAQVHRAESAFDATTYWRGPAWPQLTYLLWVAASRAGRDEDARWLREAARRGALRSGFAEYWQPDTGEGLGATPQSWSTLVTVMS